jgi:general secretion pathway protein N
VRVSLALIAFALAAVLLWEWWGWPPPLPDSQDVEPAKLPADLSSRPAEKSADLSAPLREREEYAAVTERPLFLPDRRPPSEEPEEDESTEPDVPSDLAKLDLNAVLITPSSTTAWIRDPEKKELIRLRPGDNLSGWAVQEILSDRILLERQGSKDTLVLRDYKNMPPPTPPRRTPVKRKRKTSSHAPARPRRSARNGSQRTRDRAGGRNLPKK